jgi:hypothetical protein
MTDMVPEPFLVAPVRSCRDLLHVRRRARQVAQLLKFPELDITCIAAGSFVVAQQALRAFGRAEVCFAVIERHLRVYARSRRPRRSSAETLTVLAKPLPQHEQPLAADDIAWLIGQLEPLAPTNLHDEISRQNQEVLTLLLALRGSQASCDPNPSAA